MVFGEGKDRLAKLTAQADAYRAACLTGRKSLLRRVLERLRPHRQQPGNEPYGSYGTWGDLTTDPQRSEALERPAF